MARLGGVLRGFGDRVGESEGHRDLLARHDVQVRLLVVADDVLEDGTRGGGVIRGIVRGDDESEAVVALRVTLRPTLSGQSGEGVGRRGG